MLYRSFHNLLFPANLKREGEVIPMNHVENKKKLNNKGFSLVELIIVIAIMAVLIGVLAPQYLKYVEKSRRSSDATTAEQIVSAMNILASDPSVSLDLSTDYSAEWDATNKKIVFSTGLTTLTAFTDTIDITKTYKYQSSLFINDTNKVRIELNYDSTNKLWKVDTSKIPNINS